MHWKVPHNSCGQIMPAVWNVAKQLEVEYRQPIRRSSDQSNSGRKKIEKLPCGKEVEGRGSRVEVKEGSPIKRIAFDSTPSRREVKGEEPQKWEQYSKQGRIKPVYNLNNWAEIKYCLHQRRTPNFFETDLAIWTIWSLQHKLEDIWSPKILIELRGGISLSSKMTE